MKDCLSDKEKKLILLGEMFENIIHQLKQPLNAINIEASGVKFQNEMGIVDGKELDTSMQNIIDATEFLSNTIDDFRNFIKEDKLKSKFNIIDVINNIEKILSPLFKSSGIEIIKDIKEDDIIINGYSGELAQVIINILNNAREQLKHQKSLEEKLVFIKVTQNGANILIEIYDNGGGIAENILPHIFEYKYSTKGDEGTGLGLYMSKSIIKKDFDGDIEASNITFEYKNNEYNGAKFDIVIHKGND